MSIQTETKIEFVKAFGLTLEELAGSRIPDASLGSISVTFEHPRNGGPILVPYYLVHSRIPENRALLCSSAKDLDDFREVSGIISGIVGGEPLGEIRNRTLGYDSDIYQVMILPQPPTQQFVARAIEVYSRHFGRVEIPVVYYRNVPREEYIKPGFPPEKLFIPNQ